MRAILIPVKELSRAKQRLAGALPQEQRTQLARAMMLDVFAAVAMARSVNAVFVISSDAFACAEAARRGWHVFRESAQVSESASVDAASLSCAQRGVKAMLRLPIDIPLLRAEDVEQLLAACPPGPGAVMVPSRGGQGTNALLRTPPDLFRSCFGPDSLQKHLAEARRGGFSVQVVRNPRIELDLDDEHDLRVLMASPGLGRHTREALAESLPPAARASGAA